MHHFQGNPNQELKDNIESKVFYPAARKNNSCPLFYVFVSLLYPWDRDVLESKSNNTSFMKVDCNTGKKSGSWKRIKKSARATMFLPSLLLIIFFISIQILPDKDLISMFGS